MANFISVTETEMNTVPHSPNITKGINVSKIIQVTPVAAGGAQLEVKPQSFHGIASIRKVTDSAGDVLAAANAGALGDDQIVALDLVAEGQNYPSPGFTARTENFNIKDILEISSHDSGPLNDQADELLASITTMVTGGTIGSYAATPLSGGSGSGAIATVSLDAADNIDGITVTTPGTGYKAGDILTIAAAALGGTSTVVEITLVANDFERTLVKLAQYRDSMQINYIVDLDYDALLDILNT